MNICTKHRETQLQDNVDGRKSVDLKGLTPKKIFFFLGVRTLQHDKFVGSANETTILECHLVLDLMWFFLI